MINWIPLDSEEKLKAIFENQQTAVIFKHSTSCGISGMAKKNLERMATRNELKQDIYYLDLLAHRSISNLVASLWQVEHQSPQLLIVKGHDCLFHASHGDIDFDDISRFN